MVTSLVHEASHFVWNNLDPNKIGYISSGGRGLNSRLFVPIPLVGGGTIYSNGFFFVQTILADRYIYRREMLVVSLKNSSSVEFEI